MKDNKVFPVRSEVARESRTRRAANGVEVEVYRDTSLIRKRPPPQVHRRAPGIGLL